MRDLRALSDALPEDLPPRGGLGQRHLNGAEPYWLAAVGRCVAEQDRDPALRRHRLGGGLWIHSPPLPAALPQLP